MKPLLFTLLSVLGCDSTSPVDTASCSSGSMWSGSGGEVDAVGETGALGDESDGGATMSPGQDCITCHARGEGPDFTIAGTVMGDYADIDDCIGVSDVTVTLTDADGVVTTLTTNSSGNFYSTATLAMPYTAELSAGGQTRAMAAEQSDGNCMSCHTSVGANSAPGRIVAP